MITASPDGMKGGEKTGKKTGKQTSQDTGKKTGKKTGNGYNNKVELTKRQRDIVSLLIEDNSRSVSDNAGILKISTSSVQEHFENHKAIGAIRRMGPDKGGFWEVLVKFDYNES